MAQLRQTVGSLRDSPLVPITLREMVEGVAGIDVELVRSDVTYRDDVEATILAITREALTNVVRHSGATRAIVTVADSPDGVAVDIVDNGAVSDDPVEGNGIRGMRERAESLGGRLDARRGPSGGFAVSARLPT